jgi:hypothetical protein
MTRLLPLLLLLALALPATASAEDVRRAGEIQLLAREALDKGDDAEALRLARRAISLEAGPTTWLAQQIQIEILEARGSLEQAMGCLQDYMALGNLFPEHLAWGEEARQRIGAALARQRASRSGRLGAGTALMVGGVVPLGVGVGFLANHGQKTGAGGDPGLYGGFLDAGVTFVVVGAIVEGVGIALAASTARPAGQAARFRPTPALAVSPDGRVVLGVTARF